MMIYLLLFLSIFMPFPLHALSMVYNFRIAQITKQPFHDNSRIQHNTFIMLPFEQYQKKYNNRVHNFGGGLGSFIYNHEPYYGRIDAAVSHVYQQGNQTPSFSDIQTDDILCTVGRKFEINKRNTLTLSGLFGIPTHPILRLKHADFGYGQFGTGIQIDGSYRLHHYNALVWGARYIHFIPRDALDNFGQSHHFSAGNLADVLFAYRQDWNKHGIECGCTTRIQFGIFIDPHITDISPHTHYSGSGFYTVYKYRFLIHNVANRLLFNIAYGFENKTTPVNSKHIVTVWGAWGINF